MEDVFGIRDLAIRKVHPSIVIINYVEMSNDVAEAFDNEGNQVVLDEDKIAIEESKLQAEWDAQNYARNRRDNYPSCREQLEKIYDDGLDAWRSEMIDPIKAKYPKP